MIFFAFEEFRCTFGDFFAENKVVVCQSILLFLFVSEEHKKTALCLVFAFETDVRGSLAQILIFDFLDKGIVFLLDLLQFFVAVVKFE